jgi:hypothetical protein
MGKAKKVVSDMLDHGDKMMKENVGSKFKFGRTIVKFLRMMAKADSLLSALCRDINATALDTNKFSSKKQNASRKRPRLWQMLELSTLCYEGVCGLQHL